MTIKVLTEHHLECLILKVGCRGSSKNTRQNVKLLEISRTGSNGTKNHITNQGPHTMGAKTTVA